MGYWNFPTHPSIRKRIFISWKPTPLSLLKVNFDSSVSDGRGEVGFVIHGPDSHLVAASSVRLVEVSMPGAKMRVAWEGIYFTRLTLWTDRLIIEGHYTTIVTWLQGCSNYGVVHIPLCATYVICYMSMMLSISGISIMRQIALLVMGLLRITLVLLIGLIYLFCRCPSETSFF